MRHFKLKQNLCQLMHIYKLRNNYTVKKIGHGLTHIKTNLRFFGLSLSFYSSFYNNFTEAELKD